MRGAISCILRGYLLSNRNNLTEKKIRRLQRALRKNRGERMLDMVRWLEDHGHADTAGQARKLLASGRVRSESHEIKYRVVPAVLRSLLVVADA